MNVVSRAEWGARPPRSRTALERTEECVVHYTSAFTDETGDQAARVRGVQNYHMDSNGWSDIAYSFLFSRDGTVFEGRGWGIRTSATLNANSFTHAFCFLGADKENRDDVTDAGRASLTWLIQEAERRYGTQRVSGHRQHFNTDCPGAELMRYVAGHAWETGFRELKRGDTGPRVAVVQARLDALPYIKVAVDSDFGSFTEKAVRQFQKRENLEITGVVNKLTWDRLEQASKK